MDAEDNTGIEKGNGTLLCRLWIIGFTEALESRWASLLSTRVVILEGITLRCKSMKL